jgi:Pyridine nucleotide-disulphide oxidoreductase
VTDPSTDVAIVGAGPYGVSAAAHLRRAGFDVRVFGHPMSFWRSMPAGMLLRSNWSATNIAEHRGELSLDSYLAETGARFSAPVPLERFIEYGDWVQRRAVPDVDRRLVASVKRRDHGFSLTLEDGDELTARRVAVACGIKPFAWRPVELRRLPPALVSHTGDHREFSRFAGRRLAIVGGGQSARECAALAHEAGADVEVFARAKKLVWLRGVGVKKRLGRLGPVAYAPTDVGPLWYSRLVACPDLFRRLPRRAQTRIARRSIRPAGSHWLKDRLADVSLHLDCRVVSATASEHGLELRLTSGARRYVDHLMLGTGYRVDIAKYPFLGHALLADLEQVDGFPILTRGLESSVPGLHFLGAPAAWSFGPIMRFVSGSWYASRALTRTVLATGRRPSLSLQQGPPVGVKESSLESA